MPEYLEPGVYVEETSFRSKSIEGVGTSTTGFVGAPATGPRGEAVRVSSITDYDRTFGSDDPCHDLRCAVQLYFANGGADAWIVGVPSDGSAADALAALDAVPSLALLCLPGEADPGVLPAALQYADRRRAFLIVDPPGPDRDAAVVLARELATTGSASAAMYFPRLRVADPQDRGLERVCPPSGAVAGVFARTDASRGIWKAPAGVDAVVLGIAGLEEAVDDAAQSALQVAGVNAIRTFPNIGTVLWGARTVQGADEAASEWKYVNVRRLAIYLEHSIDQGTQWAVFEPNDEPLWASVRMAIGLFLDGLFRAGAFPGRTPQEAYFVKCDRTTMTQDDLDNGRLIVEVGVAPVKPAEFVIFRIGQWAAREATEQLGAGTGEPRQEIWLSRRPVWKEGFVLQVEGPLGWSVWRMVDELGSCDPDEPVFMLDPEAGVVRFGDGVNGAIPPSGASLQATYLYGSGGDGNEPGSIATSEGPVPAAS